MLNMNAHPGFSFFPFLLLYQSAIYRLVYFDHCHPESFCLFFHQDSGHLCFYFISVH